jgi:hypothetical protein
MLLPSIRDLTFKKLDVDTHDRQEFFIPGSLAPRSVKIDSIHFDYSHVPASLVSQMLAWCEAISNFQYLASQSRGNAVQWHSEVIQALSAHPGSLKKS